jgi:threonine dehydratase
MLRVVLEDRPGALHGLLGVIADLGLNVVEVDHHRTGVLPLAVDEVEVLLALETRDRAHQEQTRQKLAAAGYRILG